MAGFSPADTIPVATAWAAIGRCHPRAISDHLGKELIFPETGLTHDTSLLLALKHIEVANRLFLNVFLPEFSEIVRRRAFSFGVIWGQRHQKRSETRVPLHISHEPIH